MKLGKDPFISDTYNNDLTESQVHLIEQYVNENRQSDYYDIFYLSNEIACEGQLKIPDQ